MVSWRPVSIASRSLVPTPSVPETMHRLAVAVQRHLDQRAEAAEAAEHLGAHRALHGRLDALDELVARVDVDAGIAIGGGSWSDMRSLPWAGCPGPGGRGCGILHGLRRRRTPSRSMRHITLHRHPRRARLAAALVGLAVLLVARPGARADVPLYEAMRAAQGRHRRGPVAGTGRGAAGGRGAGLRSTRGRRTMRPSPRLTRRATCSATRPRRNAC